MAHNVFLEGWLGLGAVLLVCTAAAYYLLLTTYVRGWRDRQAFRFVPLSCLGLLIFVTLHFLVDFSVQIPPVTLAAATMGARANASLERAGTETVPEAVRDGLQPQRRIGNQPRSFSGQRATLPYKEWVTSAFR